MENSVELIIICLHLDNSSTLDRVASKLKTGSE